MYLQENNELRNRSDMLEQQAKKLEEIMLQLNPESRKNLHMLYFNT
jgi:cell division protein FtsB